MAPDATARPTVSCIMIFLDAERFIDEAIESVLAQTGIDDWELVLVDDGSTDSSTAKAEAWARHESGRIRCVAHPGHRNEGMSASRNLGLRVSRGEFVAFLDSDDIWLPTMLSQRVRLLRAEPEADAVLGPSWTWYGWTGHPLDLRRDRLIPLPHEVLRKLIAPPEIFLHIYHQPSAWLAPGICSLFFRRQALVEIGGLEDEFTGMFEDQVLYVKAFSALTFVLDDRPLTLYRQHGASACAVAEQPTNRAVQERRSALDRFVTWMAAYVDERYGKEGPEWQAALAAAKWDRPEVHRPPAWPRTKRRLRLAAERVAPRATGALINTIKRHSGGGDGRDVTEAWTAQFVAAWASTVRCRVLVAHGANSAPAPWLLDMMSHATVLTAQPLDELHEQEFDCVVVLPEVFDELPVAAVLSTCRSLLGASGSLLGLVPGTDLPSSGVGATPRLSRSELDALARATFPAATISTEGFGSEDAVAALRRRHSAARAGVAVDHHDRRVEAMTGICITPAPT